MLESLRSIPDNEILTRTQALALKERKITLSLLQCLNEVDQRRLYLPLGHGTLFDYCTSGLGYSASAAMRRIQAARCIASFPEVYELLDKNALNLSTVCIAAKVLTAGNKTALLPRICGKSQREVEAIAAEFEPQVMAPKERVRTVVVREPMRVRPAAAEMPLLNTANGSDETVIEPAPTPREPERRTMIQFWADGEFMNEMARVRSLASHRLPANASCEELFRFALRFFLRHEDPKLRHERRDMISARPAKESDNPRHIPASIRDQVFIRDDGKCTFVGTNNHRCGSTHALQVDHIVPIAMGGKSTIDNLRLLCGKHNRFEAERVLGGLLPLR